MTLQEMNRTVDEVARLNGIDLSGTLPSLVELASEMMDRKPCSSADEADFLRIMGMDEEPMSRMMESVAKKLEPEDAQEWAEMLVENGLEWDPSLYAMATNSGIPRELFMN